MRLSRRFLSHIALSAMLLACGGSPVEPADPGAVPSRPIADAAPAPPVRADAAASVTDGGTPSAPNAPHPRSAVPCDPLKTTPDRRSLQPDADHRFLPVVIDLDLQMDTSHAAEIADVNGDGFGDLVVVAETSMPEGAGELWEGRLLVYLQNACGTLNAPIVRRIGTRWATSGGLVLADVTGDGRIDIVLGHGQPLVYAQLADGTLPDAASRVAITLPSGEAGEVTPIRDEAGTSLAFLDGPDLIVARRDAVTGQFREHARRTGAGYPFLVSGDVTGDGREDLLVLDRMRAAAIVQVFAAAAGGGVYADPEEHKASMPYAEGFAVGDVSGDGLADAVMANGSNHPNSAIAVFFQKGGTLDKPVSFPSADLPGKVRLADIDGDGRADVVVDHGSAFGVYLQDGAGSLQPERKYSCPGYNADMAVGDIDGDGLPDVVRAGYRSIAVHLNSGHR